MDLFGIPLSNSDLWLLSGCGVLLTLFIAHLLSASRDHRNAAKEFRESILEALSDLYPIPSNWPTERMHIINVLEERFPRLQSAVHKFRPSIPWYKRKGFDRAWRNYHLGPDGRNMDGQYYWQYVPNSGQGIENGNPYTYDNTQSYQESFKRNVKRLLDYAG